jgi:hypothetical protein
VWAEDVDKQGQSAYRSQDRLQDKVVRYKTVLSLRGVNVNTWDAAERSQLEAEVREQHRLREAARGPAARKIKELRRSMKSIGAGVAGTLVDETKDLPSVGNLEMFLIMGTTTVTVAVNLNYAVLSFTLIFHVLKRAYGGRVRDLSSDESKHAAGQVVAYERAPAQPAGQGGFTTGGSGGGGDAYWG